MSTPTLTSVLAKDWVLEVNSAITETSPTWVKVKGLTKLQPAIDGTTVDDSDFDSDGWKSETYTQRAWSIECEGRRKKAVGGDTFVPDPGQELIRLAGEELGDDAVVFLRWYRTDGDPQAYTGHAEIKYSGGGGGVTDLEPLSFTATGKGKRTPIENPSAA